jgi:hypothetical protein
VVSWRKGGREVVAACGCFCCRSNGVDTNEVHDQPSIHIDLLRLVQSLSEKASISITRPNHTNSPATPRYVTTRCIPQPERLSTRKSHSSPRCHRRPRLSALSSTGSTRTRPEGRKWQCPSRSRPSQNPRQRGQQFQTPHRAATNPHHSRHSCLYPQVTRLRTLLLPQQLQTLPTTTTNQPSPQPSPISSNLNLRTQLLLPTTISKPHSSTSRTAKSKSTSTSIRSYVPLSRFRSHFRRN